MKLTLDISSALFKVVNVPEITNLISGKVYIGDSEDTSQEENITIKVLNNPNLYLQSGFLNLNFYTNQVNSGRPDNSKFNQVIPLLVELIEDANMDNVHFQIDDDKGVFKDNDKDGLYFYNLRIEFQTFNKI